MCAGVVGVALSAKIPIVGEMLKPLTIKIWRKARGAERLQPIEAKFIQGVESIGGGMCMRGEDVSKENTDQEAHFFRSERPPFLI